MVEVEGGGEGEGGNLEEVGKEVEEVETEVLGVMVAAVQAEAAMEAETQMEKTMEAGNQSEEAKEGAHYQEEAKMITGQE